VRLIAGWLPQKDLAALSRTSKYFNKVVEDLLYSKVNWRWINWKSPPPFVKLLSTLMRRPELGNHVKRLCIDCTPSMTMDGRWALDAGSESPKIPILSAEMSQFVAAIQALAVDFEFEWIYHLQRGSMDTLLALLLVRLPRLVLFHLDSTPVKDVLIVQEMFATALCTHSHGLLGFERLRDVVFKPSPDMRSEGYWHNKQTAPSFSSICPPCILSNS
jgi:hypothetical protein